MKASSDGGGVRDDATWLAADECGIASLSPSTPYRLSTGDDKGVSGLCSRIFVVSICERDASDAFLPSRNCRICSACRWRSSGVRPRVCSSAVKVCPCPLDGLLEEDMSFVGVVAAMRDEEEEKGMEKAGGRDVGGWS